MAVRAHVVAANVCDVCLRCQVCVHACPILGELITGRPACVVVSRRLAPQMQPAIASTSLSVTIMI